MPACSFCGSLNENCYWCGGRLHGGAPTAAGVTFPTRTTRRRHSRAQIPEASQPPHEHGRSLARKSSVRFTTSGGRQHGRRRNGAPRRILVWRPCPKPAHGRTKE
jgi:hypothetical protein